MTEEYNIKDFEKTVINEIANMKGTLHDIKLKVEQLLVRKSSPGFEHEEPKVTNNSSQQKLVEFPEYKRTKEKPLSKWEFSAWSNIGKLIDLQEKISPKQEALYQKLQKIWDEYRA